MSKADVLTDALNDSLAVSFIYDDKPRIVEVHAVGVSTKDGSLIMRGYQVAGESSRPLPCWALFTVDKIEALQVGFIESQAPRDGYKMDDRQMANIIAQIQLEVA
jgi:hypothetical protein